MKIRSGFVSNSSTSSFIVIGFQVPYDKDNVSLWDNGIYISREEGFLIGKEIASNTSNEIFTQSLSIEEINEYALYVSEKHNVPLESIKLHFGVRES